jgi:DNA-binding NarL/FixJ family response regulator
MQILIVDRSAQIIERLEEIIAEADNITAIHSAVAYEEAKKLCAANKYDVVLLDIDLPEHESLKLVKEIKKPGGNSRVIIQFTHLDNYTREQCKLAGVDFFFDKYYDFEKICGFLDSVSLMDAKKDREKADDWVNSLLTGLDYR